MKKNRLILSCKMLLTIILLFFISIGQAQAADTDSDGLDDAIEATLGTDPGDPDTDDDGLLDGVEDADHDGIKDVSETNPLDADTDDDGLSDSSEIYTYGTNPLDSDTDDDFLDDGLELGRISSQRIAGGTSINGVSYLGTAASWVGDSNSASITDPRDADSDNDGLKDGIEDENRDGNFNINETNPVDADTDDDGLNDLNEDVNMDGVRQSNETDPLVPDTDADGLNDGLEKGVPTSSKVPSGISDGPPSTRVSFAGTAGTWVGDSNIATTTNPLDDDSDDDGLMDGNEDSNHNGLIDLTETDPNLVDTDSDKLQDGTEIGISAPQGNNTDMAVFIPDADFGATVTDPLDSDSDDDGVSDGVEDSDYNGIPDAESGGPVDDDSDDNSSGCNAYGSSIQGHNRPTYSLSNSLIGLTNLIAPVMLVLLIRFLKNKLR